jgi:glucose-1-phosphate cytidylyltransferase
MKLVILAGGLGTRISEETVLRPKPMIEIGGRPILWHIMKIYAAHGITDFVVCLGYRGYMIKEFFANYVMHGADVTIDTSTGEMTYHQSVAEPWRVTLVETGESSMTGGRVGRVAPYLDGEDRFCMTYGDGVADIDVSALVAFHKAHGKDATLTAVRPPARFGALDFNGDQITQFIEKPVEGTGYINGGFFVLEHRVLERIAGDDTVWERGPLEGLAADGHLHAFRHDGFWQPMDTLRDKNQLEGLWASGHAPWKVWA